METCCKVPKHPIKFFGDETTVYQPQIFSDLMCSHSKCLRSALGCCQKQPNFRSQRHVVSKFRTLPNVTIAPKGRATSSPSTPLLAAFNFRSSQIILDELFNNQIQVKPNGLSRLVLGQAKSIWSISSMTTSANRIWRHS